MTRQKGDYSQIWEWIYNNFDLNNYLSAEELLYDVENEFNRTKSYFPEQARDLVRERMQYQREYREMQERQDEQKQIADFIGGGQVMESITDEIVDDLRNPKAEIMGIDMTEYSTQQESVVPPDIVKFAQRQNFFNRLVGSTRNIFRRILGRK